MAKPKAKNKSIFKNNQIQLMLLSQAQANQFRLNHQG
jgi:hypothetical protein